MCMKAIQITFDEELLRALDADGEVKRLGRSAVLRKAARAYLRRSAASRIREQYKRAYGASGGRVPELEDWIGVGVWPDE
jgi:metal-responsive CopG/Arc/MetJ family transcriptional regulator